MMKQLRQTTHRPARIQGACLLLLIALLATACESPAAPAACGSLPQLTVNVGETSSVTACFNDANGDVLNYTATSSNPGVATANISGASITVAAVAPGNTTVTVTASDPGGLQGQQSFAVMVPNRAPEPRGTLPNVSLPVGQTTTIEVSQYFSEPDGETLTYSANASDPAVAGVSIAGSTVTVAAQAKGSATVTIVASDPGGLSATQSFVFTVPNREPMPVGTIGAQTVEVGSSVTLDVATSFDDPDDDPLTYTAASSIPTVARTSVSGSAVTISAVGPGVTTVTITATDNDQATATQRVRVTVPQPNRPPQRVGSIPAQQLNIGQSATVNVAAYFSDPDGDALTYTATSSSPSVTRVSVSGSTVTISGLSAGTATMTVTARDPEGLTATQQARVTVQQPNRAPTRVGSIPARSLNPGGIATVNASPYFTDPDGDALTYTAASSNSVVARASVLGSTVTISGVTAGTATITVTARDPGGLSASQSIGVRVASAGAPDLQFTNVTPTSVTGSPGGTVRATFTLRNGGNATAPATTIRIFASTNSTISTGDTEIGSDPNPSLGAGQSRTITATVRLSSQASGTFYFGLCVDRVSGESNTQNNCSTGVRVTVRGSGAPDLVVSLSRSRVTVAPGSSFSYQTTVRNQGDAASAATRIRLYQSTNATISTSDSELGQPGSVPALGASQSASGTTTIGIPSATPAGTTYVGNCVDAVPGESNTNNNCSSAVTVIIQPGGGGGGNDTTYTTGQTIETLPTGNWFPNQLGGGASFQSSGGTITITFRNSSSYMVHNSIRYSCRTSSGCQIVNRRVTRGSIRATSASGSNVVAEPQLQDQVLQVIGRTVLKLSESAETGPSADSSPRQIHSATITVSRHNP